MRLRIRLSDYRCFRREQPAILELQGGFTAFVGPNNAGKSALLKSFFELRNLYGLVSSIAGNWGVFLGGGSFSVNFPPPISDPREIANDRPDPRLAVSIELRDEPSGGDPNQVRRVETTFDTTSGTWRGVAFLATGDAVQTTGNNPVNGVSDGQLRLANGQLIDQRPVEAAARYLQNTLYIGAFRNAINEGAAQYFDLQIGTAFIDMWHQWKTGGLKDQNRLISRVTNDIARLLGASELEINASKELKTLQVLLDGGHYKLSELGSGLAELVVVLANAAIKRPNIILIDEPEAHLHPRLQIDFLTSLGAYATGGVFYSTHSLGLARAVSDYRFSIQRKNGASVIRPLEKTSNYVEFLGSLGLAALQDVGYDTILLVEGVTEVRTFQQFLRAFSLDGRVVVLPLGGSSMINGKAQTALAEVIRLTPRVFAIVDSERDAKDAPIASDRKQFAAVCEALGIKTLITERRATENYLTRRAITAAKGETFKVLGPYEKPNSTTFWGKAENWLIAREMTREELLETDVGKFLLGICD